MEKNHRRKKITQQVAEVMHAFSANKGIKCAGERNRLIKRRGGRGKVGSKLERVGGKERDSGIERKVKRWRVRWTEIAVPCSCVHISPLQ